jgi:signal transduction histidine kinase
MLKRFTRDNKTLFWTLHIGGWCGYALLNYLSAIAYGKPRDYVLVTLMYGAGGIIITWLLRFVFQKFWNREPMVIALTSCAGALTATLLFTFYRTLVYMHVYENWDFGDLPLLDYFSIWDMYLSLYVIGTWSGLYFGIKYYRTSQRQNEHVLKARSAAHQAQLKMLRYQLNPHFLFNTLNAISTLVLDGDRDTANHMVTRLSSFLRYSLDRDPMQKVNLSREIESLNLYLSIEKLRFEERLHLHFDIADEAASALVPSMVLQPLIENSIKHAIAVCEDGGTISISAHVSDGKLCLRVADDGPGVPGLDDQREGDRNGVGLANTGERLSVLYGHRHQLQQENLEPQGFAVTICIPFERNNT